MVIETEDGEKYQFVRYPQYDEAHPDDLEHSEGLCLQCAVVRDSKGRELILWRCGDERWVISRVNS